MSSIDQLPQPSLAVSAFILTSPLILASITPLSLPPKGVFKFFNQLFDTCQSHTRLAGYICLYYG
jgi:hypothetical protein